MHKKFITWKVTEQGQSLLAFLQSKLSSEKSNRAIKRAVDNNKCLVNSSVERFSTRRLDIGDHVALARVWESTGKAQKSCPIIFEDDFLIVINKPSGLESSSEKISQAIDQKVIIAHRLDKQTSGILLCCKSESAFIAMKEIFASKEIEKKYYAVVKGKIPKFKGTIKNFLGVRKRYEGQTVWGSVKTNGRFSHTDWKSIAKNEKASLLEVTPITGRTHQIRVHLSELGHPIWGDYHYDKKFQRVSARLMLHAHSVSFIHPFSKQKECFVAPMPLEMKIFCKNLRFLKCQNL